jgi:hypothetical protein
VKKAGKKILSGARGVWLRKPETKIKESAKIYKRKGRRRQEQH